MSSALQKRFRARDEAARPNGNVQTGKRLGSGIQHAFPTDDDAPMLPTRRLLAGVRVTRRHLAGARRRACYCLPRNPQRKAFGRLRELATAIPVPEVQDFVAALDLERAVFRSKHAPHGRPDKETRAADKKRKPGQTGRAIANPVDTPWRPVWAARL